MADQRPHKIVLNKAYTGFPSFLRSRICNDVDRLEAAIAILGVPFDEGSPYLPGTRMGPRAIREHSLRFVTDGDGYYDLEQKRTYLGYELQHGLIADVGDVDIWPTDVETTFHNITEMIRAVRRRGALPVVLGGDHSISYPVVRAFEEDIYVVQFDAHTDFIPFIGRLKHTNGHSFRHISEMTNVKRLIQTGIRGIRHSPAEILDSIAAGNLVLNMPEFRSLGAKGLAEQVPEGAKIYVSIDIDALDISLVPGCVSGEPNGMTYVELRDGLDALARRGEIVGFDLVEVNPPLDVATGATSFLAANIVIEFLARICDQPSWRDRHDHVGQSKGMSSSALLTA